MVEPLRLCMYVSPCSNGDADFDDDENARPPLLKKGVGELLHRSLVLAQVGLLEQCVCLRDEGSDVLWRVDNSFSREEGHSLCSCSLTFSAC